MPDNVDTTYDALYQILEDTLLAPWLTRLPGQVRRALDPARHGDLQRWQAVLPQLPVIADTSVDLNSHSVTISSHDPIPTGLKSQTEQLLRQLQPWRKGPYTVHGVHINSEWRSDFKWQRLCKHIQPLQDRWVLDVGCGNGYHGWRMLGAGAERVIGIDPGLLFVTQFHAIRQLAGDYPIHVLPLGIQDVPPRLQAFDSVFSMGILYHRRSPMDHLLALNDCLRSGGELVLETLVVDGDRNTVFVPEGRYANMRNVWFLPSCLMLETWLKRCGFKHIRTIDVTRTTVEEQRGTDWMSFHSLPDFLDPDHPERTLEGFPAPTRAILIAEKI